MKSGVVKLSALLRHKRWDAQFYLGNPSLPKEIESAKLRARQALAAVDRLKLQQNEEQQRIKQMRLDGEIT